ncbi:hypothetical protein [Actinoplanes sp. NPDC051859]|uniref:hypothetical protein n=1 Tax=Actinoplanes sp. NPDC051859 TaxID=3363909 RepID=UPI0037AE4329
MTGQPAFHSAIIEVLPAEAATGVTKAVWTPAGGPLMVVVPPGTVDGSVVWVPTPAGTVAVTIRVPSYPVGPALVPAGPPIGSGLPPDPVRARRRNALIGSSLVVVLVLGCCGIVRALGSDKAAKRDEVVAAAPTTAAPATPNQYAQLLAASDSALKVPFTALNTGDAAAFAKAAPPAATVIRAEAGKLRAAVPPAGAESAHAQLTRQLASLGDLVDEAASARRDCPAASPYASVLQSGWADGVREESRRLGATNPTFRFGTFLPAAPKEQNRRLKSGTFVVRSGGGGLGHLKIKNGAADTAVSLVPGKGKKPKPVLTVYVRSGGTYTATGIADGTYRIYTASGKDWNASRKGFTRNCTYSKFDDTFAFTTTSTSSSIWTITLTPVVGGNASTSNVDPNAFPN